MYSRFIDKKHIIEKESGFIKRTHGLSFYWLIIICTTIAGLISLPILFLCPAPHNYILIAITFLLFTGLTYFLCWVMKKDRHIMHLLELQNALFAGAARLATEFCIILKYDGSVVYVDPQYNSKFFHLKNQGMDDFNALCESGNLTHYAKRSLLTALSEGRSDHIEFTIPTSSSLNQSFALSIDPIGIYQQELSKKVSLAIQPIARPSGYFFLRAKKITVEEEYHECLNLFNLGYISIDENNQFLAVNKIFEDISGYPQADLLANLVPLESLFYEEDLNGILQHKEMFQLQTDLITKLAVSKRILMSQIVTQDQSTDKLVRHILICPLELTQQPAKTYSSLSSEHVDMFKHSPLPTILLNQQGDILDQNKAFRQLIHRIPQKHKKLNLLQLVTKNTQSHIKDILAQTSPQTDTNSGPVDIHLQGKDEQIASLYITPLHQTSEDTKNDSRIIAHLIDTTDLKNLETRFVHSQKMQAIGQLAGGIAHDFNNLLTAMTGFCDLLLLRHPAGDQSFPEIMQIKQNANRAANLVRQLLAFSRKQTLQPKVTNITDTLADLSNLIRRLIGENMTLNMVHGRDLGAVKVDPGQLEQVIINLAVNARDAMPQGGTLTIQTSNVVITDTENMTKGLIPPVADEIIEPGEYVLIEVMDTGQGIPGDILNKIFEPFFSTKEVGSGTGLGLSTVYGIIKQTSGYVYVSSHIGIGSNFYIFLKKYQETLDQTTQHITMNEETQKAELVDLTGKGIILLVEDETPVRIFSATALKNKGYTILEADCAETALEIIAQKGNDIDIIITDVVMPGMNGPTMIKKIFETHSDIKVIFVSGYGEDEFIKTYGDERSFNFLAKPYSLKQLALKVKEVMEPQKFNN